MIVKRVAESLRRQDWTAVAIEFVLVVIGVLFAFQVNEWSTERQASRDRESATKRLLEEAESTVAFFRLGVEAQKKLRNDLGHSLELVQSERWPESDRSVVIAGLAGAAVMTTPNPPSSVYDDLVSSGSFGTMGDPRMRTAVAKYGATLKFHRESVEYLRQRMPRLDEATAFTYRFDPNEPGRAKLDIDFSQLAADKELREKLALVIEMQTIALVLRERNLKRAIEMCRELLALQAVRAKNIAHFPRSTRTPRRPSTQPAPLGSKHGRAPCCGQESSQTGRMIAKPRFRWLPRRWNSATSAPDFRSLRSASANPQADWLQPSSSASNARPLKGIRRSLYSVGKLSLRNGSPGV